MEGKKTGDVLTKFESPDTQEKKDFIKNEGVQGLCTKISSSSATEDLCSDFTPPKNSPVRVYREHHILLSLTVFFSLNG